MRSDDRMWMDWAQVLEAIEGRSVVIFGSGEWSEKILPYLQKPPAYIVDNNPNEQGGIHGGIVVHAPDKLTTEDAGSVYVIIATSGYVEVSAQLKGYGLSPGTDFCVSPALLSFRPILRTRRHTQQILMGVSDPKDDSSQQTGGGLYVLDIPTGERRKITSGVTHGLVEAQDKLFVIDDEVGIRVLDLDLQTLGSIAVPTKSRPHGIAYCPTRNLIYACLSGHDKIGIFDPEKGELTGEIPISGKWAKSKLPHHHINDLCVHNNSLFVSMFSFSGNWKIGVYDGGILEFDLDTQQKLGPVVSDLWMPHTPAIVDGNLWYCDSMRGRVYNTTWHPVTEFNGFVRGISGDDEFYYVGQSMHRYIDRRAPVTNNVSLDTGVFMIDRFSKITRFHETKGLIDINSILVPSKNRDTTTRD